LRNAGAATCIALTFNRRHMDTVKMLDAVVDLANEIDHTDPIDFGMHQLDEAASHRYVASKVIEDAFATGETMENINIMLLATITHLVVENLILNRNLLELIRER
jgi:hypothetical protein